jgi:hypothetical protein
VGLFRVLGQHKHKTTEGKYGKQNPSYHAANLRTLHQKNTGSLVQGKRFPGQAVPIPCPHGHGPDPFTGTAVQVTGKAQQGLGLKATQGGFQHDRVAVRGFDPDLGMVEKTGSLFHFL